jgi:hypothetical protein
MVNRYEYHYVERYYENTILQFEMNIILQFSNLRYFWETPFGELFFDILCDNDLLYWLVFGRERDDVEEEEEEGEVCPRIKAI